METPALLDLIFQAHRRLTALEAQPRDYGAGVPLSAADVHTIEAVARSEGCNLTELASLLDISLPAAFKAAGKMVRLGCLSRGRREGNAKEVVFFLTGQGRRAFEGHHDFQNQTFGPLREVEARLPPGDRELIRRFLADLHAAGTW